MLVSLKWLAEYVPLNLPARELAEKLTLAGAKVERIMSRGADWDLIRVARVVEINPHPNADRLKLVTVEVNGTERPTVVCGAPNVALGQKIAFAAVGAHVRDGHTGEWSTLKAAKIRGVDSAGMVLSEKELGLSDEHVPASWSCLKTRRWANRSRTTSAIRSLTSRLRLTARTSCRSSGSPGKRRRRRT